MLKRIAVLLLALFALIIVTPTATAALTAPPAVRVYVFYGQGGLPTSGGMR